MITLFGLGIYAFSPAVFIEILLLAHRDKVDPERMVEDVLSLATLKGGKPQAAQAPGSGDQLDGPRAGVPGRPIILVIGAFASYRTN